MDDADRRLDGNAAAGLLAAALGFELTVHLTVCRHCGARDAVGALAAYVHGMGAVLRCPHCDGMMIRIAHTPGRYRIDLGGVRTLQIDEPPPPRRP